MVEDPKQPKEAKSIEMRIAELEDKLAKIHITEDELKAYHKVSALLGGTAAQGTSVQDCINECQIRPVARTCTIVRNCTIIRYCTIIRNCTWECFECGGGCAPGGGGFSGGGFGSLGG